MRKLNLIYLLRTIVASKDWLCQTFVTKDELKRLLQDNLTNNNAQIQAKSYTPKEVALIVEYLGEP